jgi:S-DNA-T family DNA segregation ATPase FtsK/SpoIIIE
VPLPSGAPPGAPGSGRGLTAAAAEDGHEAGGPRRLRLESKLSPEKGNEVTGLLLLFFGLFLAAAVASYEPGDPSFFHQGFGPPTRPHNLIGQVGAEVAAFGFGILGLTCLLVPVLMLTTAVRRLRRRERAAVVGRGFGALLIVATLPALLQLTVGRLPWRGAAVEAGGLVGVLGVDALTSQLNTAGTALLLVALTVIGITLLVQSTLGELLVAWKTRLAVALQHMVLWRARRAERREDDVRRDRMARQLARAAEPAADDEDEGDWESDDDLDLPLRPSPRVAASRADQSPSSARGLETGGSSRAVPSPAAANDEPRPLRAAARAGRELALVASPGSRPATSVEPRQVALPFPEDKSAKGALPPLNLLSLDSEKPEFDESELVRLGEVIRRSCTEFGVEGTIEGISPGPVITVYEFQPAPGVKVSQIVNLQDDLALALKAESVRIDRLPGRSTLGIEVPNHKRAIIRLGTMLQQETFRKSPSVLTMAIGTTIHGEPYYADLATMPHLLVAGATGSGKSVGLQSMITSIIYKASREDVQFIFIDPKRIELGVYNDIPHLKTEVVVEPKKAANALRWAVAEMERRYRLLAEVHVRSIEFYNRAIKDPEVQKRLTLSDIPEKAGTGFDQADLKPLPYYVIIIDELADLMMVASADVETSIARLAQMARAVGIHLIVATQRPSVDVLTGTIKANFPCRMAFATASRHDSRTILDTVGSEKLLGKGDMLFMPPGSGRIMRLHGAYISEQETAALVRWLKKQGPPQLDMSVLDAPVGAKGEGEAGDDGDDDLYDEASRLVVTERMGSASFLQRRMRIGFSRAARLIDLMARDGLLGPSQGSKPREVLVPPNYFTEVDETKDL